MNSSRLRRGRILLAWTLLLCLGQGLRADSPDCDALLATAGTSAEAAEYDAAIGQYLTYIQTCGVSQTALLGLGESQLEAGYASEAADTFQQAAELSYGGFGTASALYNQARACSEAGCHQIARSAIGELKSRFPGLVLSSRAEVIEAELDGLDTTPFQREVDRELAAHEQYASALELARGATDVEAVDALFDVIDLYPGTRVAISAHQSAAYVLSRRKENNDSALAEFERLLMSLRELAPQSIMRFDIQRSTAAMHQRLDMPDVAQLIYEELAQVMDEPSLSREASFQAIGAHNESLQRAHALGQPLTSEDWEALRVKCGQLKQHQGVTPLQVSRADLIIAESYHWETRTEEALEAANYHIQAHSEETDRAGLATAHLIAGECLQKQGDHEEALSHYRWIIETFGEREPWGYIGGNFGRPVYPTSLARVHYRICDALLQLDAPPEDTASACQHVLDTFPDSRYADLIRSGWQNRGQ